MSIKMLKLTPVLFMLIALFVVPASIFSSSNNGTGPTKGTTWEERPERDMRCKGETKAKVEPLCLETEISKCDKTTMEWKLRKETEGCVDYGFGYNCYEGKRHVIIGTVDCMVETITTEDYEGNITARTVCIADPDTENLASHKVDDCKDEYRQEE